MNKSKLKEHDSEIIRRYESGESCRDIARSFGSYDSSISYRLKINGIKKRSISAATKGKPKSLAHRKKVSEARINGNIPRGPEHPNWKGGVSDGWSKLKCSDEYKKWREAVYERDNYTCQWCGDSRGHNLNAHHIKHRSTHSELTCSVNNGITLCKRCHRALHSFTWSLLKILGELLETPNVKSRAISSQAKVKSLEGSTTTGV